MSSDRRALPSKRVVALSQRNEHQVLIGLEHLRNLGSHSGSCLHNASNDNDSYFFGLFSQTLQKLQNRLSAVDH